MPTSDVSAALRSRVRRRAAERCEYCLMPESAVSVSHQVDHIIALKHGGLTSAENLALCCVRCNKYKGSDLASIDPVTGKAEPLFHPRRHRWDEHLLGAEIVARTPTGRVTVRLLQMNRPERITERVALIEAGAFSPSG
jgi:hypothetical protein